MSRLPNNVASVRLSVSAYQLLLMAYPSKFRQEYGPHMLQAFQDCSIRAYRQSGPPGMLSLWALTLFDFCASLVEEHLQRETEMTKEKFIRLSGWSLMLAAVVLLAGFGIGQGETAYYDPLGGPDGFYEYGQLILIPASLLLFTVGMIGLRTRYGKPAGWLGNAGLMVAVIFGGVSFLGSIPLFMLIETEPWVSSWWILTFGGMLLMLVGLSLFGVAALQTKPLPRWNAMPLLTAIWFPLVAIIGTLIELSGGSSSGIDDYMALFALLFMLVGSMFLGYLLQKETPTGSFA